MKRNETGAVVLSGMVEGRRANEDRVRYLWLVRRVVDKHFTSAELFNLTRHKIRWHSMFA